MNILHAIKGIVLAITAIFVGLTSTKPDPALVSQVNAIVASINTTATQTIDQATTTTKEDVSSAYEIGKSVGALQAQAAALTDQSKLPMNDSPTTAPTSASTSAPSTTGPDTGATQTPVQAQPAPTVAPTVPASKIDIEIVNPIPGKGLGRQYKAADQIVDESNYIEIGAIVYGDNGEPVSDTTVFFTATDQGQNKTLKGTGDVMKIYVNGEARQVPVYSVHYEFKTPGPHQLVFTALGMYKEVTVDVQPADNQ